MELTGDLAGTLIEHIAHLVGARKQSCANGLADDDVHVCFAQVDPNLEPTQQLLQLRQIDQRLLTGANQQ